MMPLKLPTTKTHILYLHTYFPKRREKGTFRQRTSFFVYSHCLLKEKPIYSIEFNKNQNISRLLKIMRKKTFLAIKLYFNGWLRRSKCFIETESVSLQQEVFHCNKKCFIMIPFHYRRSYSLEVYLEGGARWYAEHTVT